ncbi:MAG TPA: 23S rRNA (guanosine(2251)-2'-O)-methyltransferase RlmB [Syntrophorhabdus aromaticivorans]|nr:23S rRNA (guanosine(2251)-2'-O)-methyltransferase RlmB [Syntrophorhabdus aromaticivorans]
MPVLWDRNSILQAIKEHPDMARRLWVEEGYERVSDEFIKEAKRQGVPFKIIPRVTFVKRFGGARLHVCLERDEVSYANPASFLADVALKPDPIVGAFDGIYDPQNLGNIIRSAACLEVDGIILPKDRSCGVTDTAARIARGATEHVQVVKVVNLARYMDDMKKAGFFCYGLDERGTKPLWEENLKGPVCLVLGSEDGLRRLTREKCDGILRVPTSLSFASLNVATAFALSIYEVRRQRAV